MANRKTLQDLTIKDNFMFGAVMMNEEICRELLELVLGFRIAKVTVSREKSYVYHPKYKGVRLDIIAADEKNTHYDVEMQVSRKAKPGKRSRYYHSQIDMDLLLTGEDYETLPDAYVIFICDFDPFDKRNTVIHLTACAGRIMTSFWRTAAIRFSSAPAGKMKRKCRRSW